ncbi:MAG: DUF3892 domain-containing protein [Comamonadaceae bacterium]|nr:MAG: DUF3892 domain-containing protein [Comamonadaceae bacterium]
MKERELNCVSRPPRTNDHSRITHIGYMCATDRLDANQHSAQVWQITVQEAITEINAGTTAFYTVHQRTGMRAYLGVVSEPGRPPYLQARVGGLWNDHLLTQRRYESDAR